MEIKVLKVLLTDDAATMQQKLQEWVDSIDLNIVDLKVTYTDNYLVYTAICFQVPAPPEVSIPIPAAGEEEDTHVILQG